MDDRRRVNTRCSVSEGEGLPVGYPERTTAAGAAG